jgi:hypothetical protein
MLIGLMFLPNPLVYTQFHPVAYMVKLNIEMTMASLIKRIAQASVSEREGRSMGRYTHEYADQNGTHSNTYNGGQNIKSGNHTFASAKARKSSDQELELGDDHIHKKTVVKIMHENVPSSDGESLTNPSSVYNGFDRRPHGKIGMPKRKSDDELPLHP